MLASLGNAIWAIRGAETAFDAHPKLSRWVDIGKSEASLAGDRHAFNIRFELRKVKHVKARHFESLPIILSWIFLVGLFCRKEMNHTICVDMTRWEISNRAQRYQLSFRTEARYICAGENKTHTRIGEVSEVVNGRLTKNMVFGFFMVFIVTISGLEKVSWFD